MTQPVLYTVEDLMEIFQVSKTTLYSRKKADGWPCFLIGCKVRFSETHLETILSLYEKQPQPKERRDRLGIRARRTK